MPSSPRPSPLKSAALLSPIDSVERFAQVCLSPEMLRVCASHSKMSSFLSLSHCGEIHPILSVFLCSNTDMTTFRCIKQMGIAMRTVQIDCSSGDWVSDCARCFASHQVFFHC